MSLEMNNRALVFQKTSALLLISSDMHQSVFAVSNGHWGNICQPTWTAARPCWDGLVDRQSMALLNIGQYTSMYTYKFMHAWMYKHMHVCIQAYIQWAVTCTGTYTYL